MIDGVGDVFGDALLVFDFGGAQHVLKQSLCFAQLGVRQRLRLLVFGVAAERKAQQLGRSLNLFHGFHPMAFDPQHLKVRLVFLVGTPKAAVSEYLQLVAALSRLLKNKETRDALLAAPTEAEFRAVLARAQRR